MKKYNIRIRFFLMLFLIQISGCKKFVTVDPPVTQLVTSSVFENDRTAIAAMNGLYSIMQGTNGYASGGYTGIGVMCGLSADELTNYSADPNQIEFYKNALTRNNSIVFGSLWIVAYQCLYNANGMLEGLDGSATISAEVKKELTGEAKFIRAFCNFYLTGLFGDIPLILSTNYKTNALMHRTKRDSVYSQIILDLKDAQTLLAGDYSWSMGERVRPNSWAATALLSRIYLYTGDWPNAEIQATTVIDQTSLFQLVTDLNQVFLKNSTEAIWQLIPNQPGLNTNDGSMYILTSAPVNAVISPDLLNVFETGDLRKENWVADTTIESTTYYYPFKYKVISGDVITEYNMVLRLAETYLIRAEARAHLNNLTGAVSDINLIRNRAGLGNISVTDQPAILSAVQHERQVELFTEWGHRWLDLVRTGQAVSVLSASKGSFKTEDLLYPIPQAEIQADPNLTQNPSY